jgi:hypothetical protein
MSIITAGVLLGLLLGLANCIIQERENVES